MDLSRDELFILTATENGLLDETRAQALREAQARLRLLGESRAISQIARTEEILRLEDIARVRGKMARDGNQARLGEYELISTMGSGTLGTVFKARRSAEARFVAVKVLRRQFAMSSEYTERFKRKTAAARKVRHPGLAALLDAGLEGGRWYAASEFVEGRPLEAVARGAMGEAEAFGVVRQVAEGLLAAHRFGVVHSDVKPGNILVTRLGRPVLTDIGVPKAFVGEGASDDEVAALLESAVYGAPERDAEDEGDARSDIYSLGAVAFRLLCGKAPFTASDPAEARRLCLSEGVADPRKLRARVTDGAAEVVRRMTAADPADRYPAMGDFLAALDALAPRGVRSKAFSVAERLGGEELDDESPARWEPPREEPNAQIPALSPEPPAGSGKRRGLRGAALGICLLVALALAASSGAYLYMRWSAGRQAAKEEAARREMREAGEELERLRRIHGARMGGTDEVVGASAIRTGRDPIEVADRGEAPAEKSDTSAVTEIGGPEPSVANAGNLLPALEDEGDPFEAGVVEVGEASNVDESLAPNLIGADEPETPQPPPGATGQSATAQADAPELPAASVSDPPATPTTQWPFSAEEANRRQCAVDKLVVLPEGWRREDRRVRIASPEGDAALDVPYYVNTVGMRFVCVPAGEFMMGGPGGANAGASNELPRHRVAVPQAVFVGATEVTQDQYSQVTGENPSFRRGLDLPVENVSWNDANAFCRALSERENAAYRLPTEAEWEFACRAGSQTPYFCGVEIRPDCGWYQKNSGSATHPAGTKTPNAFGLHDMAGNVYEWCQSLMNPYPYREDDGREELDRAGGRALRGGSYLDVWWNLRSAFRLALDPSFRDQFVGFRVVVPAELSGTPKSPPPSPVGAEPPGRPAPSDSAAVEPERPLAETPDGWSRQSERVTVATPGGEATKTIERLTNTIGMRFRLVPPGEFVMGSDSGADQERPAHRVRLARPFFIGVHEVTQAQYERVTGENPSRFRDASRPVDSVSWHDAAAFCRKLSEMEGATYRLPTEAEWEYACRAGTTMPYYWGDEPDPSSAWHSANSGSMPHRVGLRAPNPFGLYDMSGNVFEWCRTLYKPYPYDPMDGREDLDGEGARVLRGGSWYFGAPYMRSAFRASNSPDYTSDNVGFRVVVVPKAE